MAYYKWFQAGAVDPVRDQEWSTDGLAKMKGRGGAQSVAWRPEQLANGSLQEELWEVELEKPEETPNAVLAKKGRLVRREDAWNDEVAGEIAKEWIFGARDRYAEALRIGERQADGPAGLGDQMAAAGTRKDIEAAADATSQELRRIYDALGDETESREKSITLVLEVSSLWDATQAVVNDPPHVAASKAFVTRHDSAVSLKRATDQFERGLDYAAAFQASLDEFQAEFPRIGEEFAGRLALAR